MQYTEIQGIEFVKVGERLRIPGQNGGSRKKWIHLAELENGQRIPGQGIHGSHIRHTTGPIFGGSLHHILWDP